MKVLILIVLLLCPILAAGAEDERVFASSEQEQEWRELTAQLRCPKCQNNSIADSNAAIAADMRQKVWSLLQEGQSRAQIVDYMVARYGQFVTYDPPFTPWTALLWLLPGAVIVAGGVVIFRRSRRRVTPSPTVRPAMAGGAPFARWQLVIGVALASGVGVGCYLQTGGAAQVRAWRAAVEATPALLARLEKAGAQPLNDEALQQLTLGLRTRLLQDTATVPQLALLARLATLRDDTQTALHAWRKAWRLAPDNTEALLGYVKGLTRSANPEDKRHGGELLRARMQTGATDVRIMILYAANALEQGRREEAVKACQALLRTLARDDPRREMIENLLAEARR